MRLKCKLFSSAKFKWIAHLYLKAMSESACAQTQTICTTTSYQVTVGSSSHGHMYSRAKRHISFTAYSLNPLVIRRCRCDSGIEERGDISDGIAVETSCPELHHVGSDRGVVCSSSTIHVHVISSVLCKRSWCCWHCHHQSEATRQNHQAGFCHALS